MYFIVLVHVTTYIEVPVVYASTYFYIPFWLNGYNLRGSCDKNDNTNADKRGFLQHCSKPAGSMIVGNFLISQAAVKKSSTLWR